MSKPHVAAPLIRREYPLALAPFVCLLAALLFPLPTAIEPCLLSGFVTISAVTNGRRCSPVDFRHFGRSGVEPAIFVDRMLHRLEEAERVELNPHYRDDIRIAWITALYAWRGDAQPHVSATRRVLGLHPDQVFAAITARRTAKLGRDYSKWYDSDGNLRPDPVISAAFTPRKPVQPDRRLQPRAKDAAA